MNKFVDEYNNSYHLSVGKNHINVDCSAFTEEFETTRKAHKFKVDNRVSMTKYKSTFSKGYIKTWPKKIFVIDSLLKTTL